MKKGFFNAQNSGCLTFPVEGEVISDCEDCSSCVVVCQLLNNVYEVYDRVEIVLIPLPPLYLSIFLRVLYFIWILKNSLFYLDLYLTINVAKLWI